MLTIALVERGRGVPRDGLVRRRVDFGYGLMWAASGLGAVIGALIASSLARAAEHDRRVRGSRSRLMGIGEHRRGRLARTSGSRVWCVLVGGIGNATAIVCNSLLVQRGAPDARSRPGLHVIMGSNFAVLGIGMALTGPLVDAVGPRWVYGDRRRRSRLVAAADRLRDAAPRAAAVAEPVPRREHAPARMDARDARRRRPRGRPARARAGDHARRETATRSPATSSTTSTRRPGRRTRSASPARPGVGKSSLIGALLGHVRGLDQTAGVVSVDPSSPFSQGALLGDRIRLADHFLDPGVFIRSMGTRGHLGGLAEATLQSLLILDAAGKDVVFLETVGTGQSEIEVIGVADTVVLVLMPGSGDSIQALKAGIMEIPDVIAINKMDHPAAKTMLSEVRSVLALDRDRAWKVPIVLTEAQRGENVPKLWETIEEHRAFLEREGGLEERRRRNLAGEVFAVASARARGTPRGGGRARPRAPAAARRRAGARARPADGGGGDRRAGIRDRCRRSLTSSAPVALLDGVARVTPVYGSETFSRLAGREVQLKAENLQRTGSFKIRGAVNKLASLGEAERAAGVVAASAGNHAQAVAWAAREAGVRATIFVPQDAPMAKVEATRSYGAKVEMGGRGARGGDRDGAAADVEETGATFVHPYEDEIVVAGQGTIGLELAEQVPQAETVLVPIGGGGLAAGIGRR